MALISIYCPDFFGKKTNENSKLPNLKLLNNNINIVSKTLILGAHVNVPCAPELGHIDGRNKHKKGQ